jgi:FkbH-like protein
MPEHPARTTVSTRPSTSGVLAGHEALDELMARVAETEMPEPALCLKIARELHRIGDHGLAFRWLGRIADTRGSFMAWASGAAALSKFERQAAPPARRSVRLAVAGTYTTSQLGRLLRLAALRRGIKVEVFETGFNAYVQEVLDPGSALYAFDPDYVLLAPHDGAIQFPAFSANPDAMLDDEVARWQSLWQAITRHSRARVIQHNIAIRPESAWGHLSSRVPASRDEMLRALNTRLGSAAGDGVAIVDCDRIAATVGKNRWFDARYWHLAKQAVALDALPELARHTAAVLAGAEGLSSKCVVLDLDNTLWGGVIAEEGLAGLHLGDGPKGEPYVTFQEYLLALRARGILLAVVSKNNDHDAREPFLNHPDMRLRLADIAAFRANWTDKATNLRSVSEELNIGLDSLVFVDDSPAERQVVRQLLPEVEVPVLPTEASDYVRALSETLLFEASALTSEDLARADQYRVRAAAASLQQQAGSLEEFYASLGMEAFVAPFDELNLPRIVQLIGKTNQFNVTTRRHGRPEVLEFMHDPRCITQYLRLRDHFGDHGLVAVLIACQADDAYEIDSWLMSCRVIGRTVENEMLSRLCESVVQRGCSRVRGTFIPTAKNEVVRDVFAQLGFVLVASENGRTTWEYDITEKGIPTSEYIRPTPDALLHA